MTFYRPQTRHTENVRTRNDERARLAQYLTWARSLDGETPETLHAKFRKLPAAEVAASLAEAKARRAARG